MSCLCFPICAQRFLGGEKSSFLGIPCCQQGSSSAVWRGLERNRLNRGFRAARQRTARSVIAFFARRNKVSPAECYPSSFLTIFRCEHYNPVWQLTTLAAMVIPSHAHADFICPRISTSTEGFAGVWRPITPVLSD
jgi:hypothetical protein